MRYNRVLLKISGESLINHKNCIIDNCIIDQYANDIKSVFVKGIQIAIVLGGGNICRGYDKTFYKRLSYDNMGMLSTVINSIALKNALFKVNIHAKLMSAIEITSICEIFSPEKAIQYLNNNEIILLCGGIGTPYFTTDTAAAIRALELNADVLLKGTKVDGIYSCDPNLNKNAIKFSTMSYNYIYNNNINIMDRTAFILCEENNLPIIIFNIKKKDNFFKLIFESNIGTLVK